MKVICVRHVTLFTALLTVVACAPGSEDAEVAVNRQALVSSNWVLRSWGAPSWRTGSASVFDVQRKRTVLFGGYSETHRWPARDEWEFDGVTWTNRVTGLPLGRNAFSMTYDSTRSQVVLFGGLGDGQRLDDTWVKDGARWTEKLPTHKPSPRADHSLAFDPGRSVVVLFGGFVNDTHSNDTWEWNGSDWTQRSSAQVPPPRINHALAYDPSGGGVLLYGGQLVPPPPMPNVPQIPFADTLYEDTWRWNGGDWVQLSGGPGKRRGTLMVTDTQRNRVVLFGGDGVNGTLNDTWEWNGTAWNMVSTQHAPPGGSGFTLAYDSARSKVVWSTGFQTWEYDGADWAEQPVPGGLSPRRTHSLSFDSARNQQVLFAGEVAPATQPRQTWLRENGSWRLGQATLSGPQFGVGRMVYETAAASTLLLIDGQTHRWDGMTWSLLQASGPPYSRWNTALAYDEVRKSVWLYTTTVATDTQPSVSQIWEWNGTTWAQHNPAVLPPPRSDTSLVYDMARKVTVLFGGQFTDTTTRTLYNDTWEWDGSNWLQKETVNSPSARFDHPMVYDRAAQRVVLFGGQIAAGVDNQTWQYDGTNWEQLSPVESPSARDQHAMAYDTQTGHVVLVGGRAAIQGAMSDVWELNFCRPGELCGTGGGGGGTGGEGGGQGTGGNGGGKPIDTLNGDARLVVGICGCTQGSAAWPFTALLAVMVAGLVRRRTRLSPK